MGELVLEAASSRDFANENGVAVVGAKKKSSKVSVVVISYYICVM